MQPSHLSLQLILLLFHRKLLPGRRLRRLVWLLRRLLLLLRRLLHALLELLQLLLELLLRRQRLCLLSLLSLLQLLQQLLVVGRVRLRWRHLQRLRKRCHS